MTGSIGCGASAPYQESFPLQDSPAFSVQSPELPRGHTESSLCSLTARQLHTHTHTQTDASHTHMHHTHRHASHTHKHVSHTPSPDNIVTHTLIYP